MTGPEWGFVLFWLIVSSAVVLAVPWLLQKEPELCQQKN